MTAFEIIFSIFTAFKKGNFPINWVTFLAGKKLFLKSPIEKLSYDPYSKKFQLQSSAASKRSRSELYAKYLSKIFLTFSRKNTRKCEILLSLYSPNTNLFWIRKDEVTLFDLIHLSLQMLQEVTIQSSNTCRPFCITD